MRNHILRAKHILVFFLTLTRIIFTGGALYFYNNHSRTSQSNLLNAILMYKGNTSGIFLSFSSSSRKPLSIPRFIPSIISSCAHQTTSFHAPKKVVFTMYYKNHQEQVRYQLKFHNVNGKSFHPVHSKQDLFFHPKRLFFS